MNTACCKSVWALEKWSHPNRHSWIRSVCLGGSISQAKAEAYSPARVCTITSPLKRAPDNRLSGAKRNLSGYQTTKRAQPFQQSWPFFLADSIIRQSGANVKGVQVKISLPTGQNWHLMLGLAVSMPNGFLVHSGSPGTQGRTRIHLRSGLNRKLARHISLSRSKVPHLELFLSER